MLELSRTVRFCLGASLEGVHHNSFAALPGPVGLSPYLEADILCVGEADPVTGYFINIKAIDVAARESLIPELNAIYLQGQLHRVKVGALMRSLHRGLDAKLNQTVDRLTVRLSPYYEIGLCKEDMDMIEISQEYQFSAAHRLHVPSMSDDENVATFGKCNNLNGHGHNYRLRVVVGAQIQVDGSTLSSYELDRLVDQLVIDRLDHKHLNRDVEAFAQQNPSVEHITLVIYEWLKDEIKAQLGCELKSVSVWETGKTVCTYRG